MCHFNPTVISAPGKHRDSSLGSCLEPIRSSARAVDELILRLSKDGAVTPGLQLPCLQSVVDARDELHSALRSLSSPWSQEGAEGEENSVEGADSENQRKGSQTIYCAVRNRIVKKVVYANSSGVACEGNPEWV